MIGFVTGNTIGEVAARMASPMVNVFVPTTPNPTSGFLLFCPREDVIFHKMTVEEAVKLVVSGGIVTPPDRSQTASPVTPVATKNKVSKKLATKKAVGKKTTTKKITNKTTYAKKTAPKTTQAKKDITNSYTLPSGLRSQPAARNFTALSRSNKLSNKLI